MKNTVNDALEISVKKQTHRGRKDKIDDDIDYIWDRIEGRHHSYFYQINRDSKLYQFVKEKMSEEDYGYFEIFINEIEKNIPIQQMYIDQSNDAITVEDSDNRFDDVFQLGITMVEMLRRLGKKSILDIVDDLMKSEPFCNYENLKNKLIENYTHEP